VTTDDIFFTTNLSKLSDLMELYRNVGKPSLKEPSFNPRIPPQLASSEDLFAIIRDGDVLLHRPYDSFTPIVEFVQTAAEDPEVLAIKQTLYRTDTGSAIIEALVKAAQRGKQVTAIVELQARFDESKNIAWARRLEEAGVQVVYGLVGIKTHSKICMVIRREGTELRRYVHMSTGNYNAVTARIYTDIDLFTVDPAIGDDASQFMNLLTGYSIATIQDIFDKQVPGWNWKHLVVAPMDYHEFALRMIDREARNAKEGKPAHIIAKLNALVDPTVTEALYKASQAGVKIDLIVRGVCCLVPGVSGLSENIKVTSIIDRFLEHSRLLVFRNGGATEVYVTSGDWMPRNFFRRIEICYPILSEKLRVRIEEQILKVSLADNVKAWRLQPDGTYKKRSNSEPPLRSQEKFIELARAEAVRLGPYEETITKPAAWRKKAKRHRKRDKEKTKS
jgi:polyphosphate kinase